MKRTVRALGTILVGGAFLVALACSASDRRLVGSLAAAACPFVASQIETGETGDICFAEREVNAAIQTILDRWEADGRIGEAPVTHQAIACECVAARKREADGGAT